MITPADVVSKLQQMPPEDVEWAVEWLRKCAQKELWRLPDAKRDDVGEVFALLNALVGSLGDYGR